MIPINDIIEDMEMIEDLHDRYHYLIELGKKLPLFPKEYMTDQNIVAGCMSKLWMVIEWENKGDQDPIMIFYAVSDSQIVCGLLYIVKSIYAHKKISEILKMDSLTILQHLGLTENLSQKRMNGLYTIVNKIQDLTQEYLNVHIKER
ncbi:SufE family protein [Candidatus Liberibacter asiaticus]|uniref:Fe-S metabolism associated domain-containing protein n=2 Tax=Liberibacter asiaticus TaxID=34021 RepID=C6XGG8_LIBAP|nr:SufE family protein [Candidatus Liberibacter asiaticus]ACT57471.1 hypothetical protein CLIBASIA_04495 [Candidatus Liberibacter asiaticus str. psy62]AGH17237.1 hypothetical protein WSI_04335 [Candidatus Liberibacter asiaticus str. gxpsy]ALK07533.1 SufE family protein [Candidatus Liberibacter asiaticus]ASK53025.1 hypothetical protein B2I23_04470 [Candidatus Liberibacter asiaticus]AWL14348.1 SufE family protein [Candidatus Liberibacter asiaticus]